LPSPPKESQRSLLWLVAAGFFMQTLDSTIVNTALPAMARSLHESPLRMESVIIAYSLTMAMLIPASGWLADRFGTRTVLFCAIVLFVAGSLLCSASSSLHELGVARVLQGAGGSMLLPVGRLAVIRSVPRERFLQAMSFVTVPGLVGPLIGPTLGGWLSEYSSWHWIFLINVPVGTIGAIATLRIMPQLRQTHTEGFDLAGYLMIAAAMVAISLGLDGLSELHLRHAAVVILLVFGLAALSGYWLHAAQRPEPLFSPQLFGIPTFSIGLIGNLFARIGSGSVPFLLPLTLQVGLGYSPAQAGMMMIPTAVAAIVTRRGVVPLIMRFGYRRVLMANTVLVGGCIAGFALISAGQPLWLRIAQFALFGAVNSLQFASMNTLTLKDLGPANASSGNSLLSMVQMVAMSFGVATAAALLTGFTLSFDAGEASGARAAHLMQAFHATFVSVGLITIAAAWIFSQLSRDVKGDAQREPTVEAAPS
jgi:EmrB/QacA subfamily drug resistance transporter